MLQANTILHCARYQCVTRNNIVLYAIDLQAKSQRQSAILNNKFGIK